MLKSMIKQSLKIHKLFITIILIAIGCYTFSLTGKASIPKTSVSNSSGEDTSSTPMTFTNPETGYISVIEDDAGLLTKEEKEQLALIMRKITAYGNVAFNTIDYNDYQASYYAEKHYHELFDTESGTLFLIDMDNREIYLFSDGAIYHTVTKSYAYTITDNVYSYASDEDYYSCAQRAFEQELRLLQGQKIAQPMKYISNALLALLLAALINYFLVRILSTTPKPKSADVLHAASTKFAFHNSIKTKTGQTKKYSPQSSGSGGHGGGGGGGHSGGGGGHSF